MSEVREAILPETTKKNLAPVPNFGEGGGQPKAGRQARRKLQKGTIQNFWEGGRRPKAGQQAKGQPTSQKGTIQNFWEGGCRPKAGQQARREQYKIFGKYHILGSTAAEHETL